MNFLSNQPKFFWRNVFSLLLKFKKKKISDNLINIVIISTFVLSKHYKILLKMSRPEYQLPPEFVHSLIDFILLAFC